MYHSTRDLLERAAASTGQGMKVPKLSAALTEAAKLRWLVAVDRPAGGWYVISRHAFRMEAMKAADNMQAWTTEHIVVIDDTEPHYAYAAVATHYEGRDAETGEVRACP